MDQKLKTLLNEKLNALPLREALPDFSKEATWDELSARLEPEEKKTRPFIGRWSYAAAALIAGLIIGGMGIIKYLQRTDQMQEGASSVIVNRVSQSPLPMQKQSTPDTPVTATSSARSLKPTILMPARINTPQPVAAQTNNAGIMVKSGTQQEAQQQPAQPLEKTPVIAIAEVPAQPRRRQRAVHLLDIESEDKTALINDDIKVYTAPAFTFYISPSRLPSGRDAQSPASVLARIIR